MIDRLRAVNTSKAPYANEAVATLCHEAADRIAELEAALRTLVSWEGPVELTAPELGGLIRAMHEARKVLDRK